MPLDKLHLLAESKCNFVKIRVAKKMRSKRRKVMITCLWNMTQSHVA